MERKKKVKARVQKVQKGRNINPLTLEEIEEALKKSHGICYRAADELKQPASTIYNRIKRSKRLQKVVETQKALYHKKIFDKAKDNIYQKVLEGDISSSKYILDRLGRAEGFGNHQSITIGAEKGLEDIHFRVTFLDATGGHSETKQAQTIFRKKKKV